MSRPPRSIRVLVSAVALGVLGAASSAGADLAAPDADVFHHPGTELDAAAAAQEDAAAVAGRTGEAVVDVMARAARQDAVSVAMVELMDVHAGTFSAARWSPDDTVLELAFTGPAPADALALLPDEVPVATHIAPMSQVDLLDFVDDVAGALGALGLDFVAVPDGFAGVVDVEVHDELPPFLPSVLMDDRVTLREVPLDEPGSVAAHGRGGQQQVAGGSWSCTTAFTVKLGGTRGQLSADHCANDDLLQYEPGWPDDPSFEARFKDRADPKWGDLQWSDTPAHGDYPTFYSKWDAWRTVARMGAAVPGQDLCHFGRANGYNCEEVYKVGVTSGGYSRGVMFHRNSYVKGDSGGPVFWSTTGYGVNSTIQNYFGIKRGVFSQLIYIDEGLGLNMVYG